MKNLLKYEITKLFTEKTFFFCLFITVLLSTAPALIQASGYAGILVILAAAIALVVVLLVNIYTTFMRSLSLWMKLLLISFILEALITAALQLIVFSWLPVAHYSEYTLESGADINMMSTGFYLTMTTLTTLAPIIMLALTVVTVSGKKRSSELNTLLARGNSREQVFLARSIALIIGAVAITLARYISAYLAGAIAWGFGSGMTFPYIYRLVIDLFCIVATVCIYNLITVIVNHRVWSTILCVVYSIGPIRFALHFIELALTGNDKFSLIVHSLLPDAYITFFAIHSGSGENLMATAMCEIFPNATAGSTDFIADASEVGMIAPELVKVGPVAVADVIILFAVIFGALALLLGTKVAKKRDISPNI